MQKSEQEHDCFRSDQHRTWTRRSDLQFGKRCSDVALTPSLWTVMLLLHERMYDSPSIRNTAPMGRNVLPP